MLTKLVVDCSTTHITKSDCSLLEELAGNFPLVVYEYEEGFFVHTPEMTEDLRAALAQHGMSSQFIRLVDDAQAQGATYLQLDADGEVYAHLARFEW